MATTFTFRKAIVIKRIRSKMNVANGGLKRSYQSWEFVRLTVSSHIIAPGTTRAYARVDKPITAENGVGNSIFSEAMIKALQKTGLIATRTAPAKPINAASPRLKGTC